jgi:peptidyl-prolyl cis-trans isomerase C
MISALVERRYNNKQSTSHRTPGCEGILRGLSRLVSLLILQIALLAWPQRAGSAPQAASPPKAQSVSGERVVLSIGDQKMTAADVEKIIQALPPNFRSFYSGQGKRLLAAYIVRMKVLSTEAIKQKVDQQPEVAREIEIARESILADAAQKHIEEGITVSDQELRELYQKDKAQSQEVRVAHIVIQTENAPLKSGDPSRPGLPDSEARKKLEDIRKQILAGADFAQMAKQYSDDTATAANGGDMGFIRPDKIVPPIMNAAYALEPGQVSDILATPSGFEIIKVEEKRTKSFEEVKPALESRIRQSKANEIIRHLMQESGAFIDPEFFGPGHAPEQNPPSSPPSH